MSIFIVQSYQDSVLGSPEEVLWGLCDWVGISHIHGNQTVNSLREEPGLLPTQEAPRLTKYLAHSWLSTDIC